MVLIRLLPHKLNKLPVFLTDFICLLEGPCALCLKAPEVVLHITNVGLKIAPDQFGILSCGLRIARNKGSIRGKTGFGMPHRTYDYKQYCKDMSSFLCP